MNAVGLAKDVTSPPGEPIPDVLMRRQGARFHLQLQPVRAEEILRVSLYNAMGRLLLRTEYRSQPVELDLSTLPQGGYLAELSWIARGEMRQQSVWLET